MTANITIHIAPSADELSSPLNLTAFDSDKDVSFISWIGPGALISGDLKLDNWTAGIKDIYSINAPPGTKSRNFYANGQASNHARKKVANRKEFTYTANGLNTHIRLERV